MAGWMRRGMGEGEGGGRPVSKLLEFNAQPTGAVISGRGDQKWVEVLAVDGEKGEWRGGGGGGDW